MALSDIDPNGRSLLAIINIYADFEAQKRAYDFLNRMGLPDAEEGEYFLAQNKKNQTNVARLYLPDGYSVSFAFRNVNPLTAAWSWAVPSRAVESARVYAARKIVDPEILQPLYQEDLSPNCCVEIVPGIPRASVGREGLEKIRNSLAKRNIDFYTTSEEFVGIVRSAEGEQQTVVTNRRAIRITPSYVASGQESACLQDKIYGSLRAEFKAVHDSGSAERIQKLLKESRDPRHVFPYWKKPEAAGSPRLNLIVSSATNYALRLAGS